jgi:hypothetical protein
MGSIQWEIQPASQREDLLAMATKLEQIYPDSCGRRKSDCEIEVYGFVLGT